VSDPAGRLEALERRLAQQDRQLAEAQERRELVRDMHDGVGGRLVALLTRVREAPPDQAELAASVQASLDDLRLVVDALDSAGDPLDVALAVWCERMRPRLRAEGVALTLAAPRLAGQPAVEGYGPREMMTLLRIVHEAVGLAREARARAIRVVIIPAEGGGARIAVRGEGCAGSAGGVPSSRQALLQRRAERVGARFRTGAAAGELRFELDLDPPVRPREAPQASL
jgi:two-component system sensor histidine kinase UhpB